MNIVTACWIETSLAEFEYNNALLFWAEHLSTCQSFGETHVLVFDGFQRFPAHYIERLRAYGVMLVDASEYFRRHRRVFEQISHATNKYESMCFVRWLVFDEYFGGADFVHLDMDLYPCPKLSIFDAFPQGSGALQGCPALTYVRNSDWMSKYRELVDQFLIDPEAVSSAVKFPGTPYRKYVGSDQDLIMAAQASNSLPYSLNLSAAEAEYYWSMNPLYVRKRSFEPVDYRRAGGQDFISGRPVLFWHMQRDFCNYLGVSALLEPVKAELAQGGVNIGESDFRLQPSLATALIRKMRIEAHAAVRGCHTFADLERLLQHPFGNYVRAFSREYVSRRFIGDGDFRWLFAEEFWHKSGDFASSGIPPAEASRSMNRSTVN